MACRECGCPDECRSGERAEAIEVALKDLDRFEIQFEKWQHEPNLNTKYAGQILRRGVDRVVAAIRVLQAAR